jgi:hypothetical protein
MKVSQSFSAYWSQVGCYAWDRTRATFGGKISLVTIIAGAVAFVIKFLTAEGDDKVFDLVWSMIAGISASFAVGLLTFLVHFTKAPWLLHTKESDRATAAEAREQQAGERLKPRLQIEMTQECCRPRPEIARVGVRNKGSVTVNNAFVYVSIPRLRISERQVAWDSTPPDRGLAVQDGLHYHTDPLVSVGDQPGQFFVHFARGVRHQQIKQGEYELLLSATGQDTTAATAKVVVECGPGRAMTVRFEPGR